MGLLAASLARPTTAAAQHEHGGQPGQLGKVNFETSCQASVQPEFNRAVAMLHSFWYAKAEEAFAELAKKDPACGMAWWGVAMTHYHAMWEAPGPADLKAGWEAIRKAQAAGAKTEREHAYIAALETFYKDYETKEHPARALAYEKAMEELAARYPQDREATIFYALEVRANAPPADKTYANQKKAGAILEKMFAEQPEHPGLAHYIIHCYDYPTLADRAVDAARRYARIAPDSPHAQHMPSHIFTRLGLWQESIDSNLASAAAARNYGATGDELHAADYLVYAYLQTGQDAAAKKLLAEINAKISAQDPAQFAGSYALGTAPARFAVERRQWTEAAALPVPANPPTARYAWTRSNLYYARGLGAARLGKADAAEREAQTLAAIRDSLAAAKESYWAEQVDIQREVVNAWVSWARGKKEDALRQMQAAADHEDRTDKHPVTPGVLVPARELLGDMLLDAVQPQPALEAFETTLRGAPNRYQAVAGAARAAELAGDKSKAAQYSAKLVEICQKADTARPELQRAKELLTAARNN
jgi:hypothetical protein